MPVLLVQSIPLLVATVVVLVLAALIHYVRRDRDNGAVSFFRLLEFTQIIILSIVLLTVFTLLAAGANGTSLPGLEHGARSFALATSLTWGALCTVLMLGTIVPGLAFRNSITALCLSFLWASIVFVAVYMYKVYPTVRAIREADAANLLGDSILVSIWILPFRLWLWATVTLAGGISFARRRFSLSHLTQATIHKGDESTSRLYSYCLHKS